MAQGWRSFKRALSSRCYTLDRTNEDTTGHESLTSQACTARCNGSQGDEGVRSEDPAALASELARLQGLVATLQVQLEAARRNLPTEGQVYPLVGSPVVGHADSVPTASVAEGAPTPSSAVPLSPFTPERSAEPEPTREVPGSISCVTEGRADAQPNTLPTSHGLPTQQPQPCLDAPDDQRLQDPPHPAVAPQLAPSSSPVSAFAAAAASAAIATTSGPTATFLADVSASSSTTSTSNTTVTAGPVLPPQPQPPPHAATTAGDRLLSQAAQCPAPAALLVLGAAPGTASLPHTPPRIRLPLKDGKWEPLPPTIAADSGAAPKAAAAACPAPTPGGVGASGHMGFGWREMSSMGAAAVPQTPQAPWRRSAPPPVFNTVWMNDCAREQLELDTGIHYDNLIAQMCEHDPALQVLLRDLARQLMTDAGGGGGGGSTVCGTVDGGGGGGAAAPLQPVSHLVPGGGMGVWRTTSAVQPTVLPKFRRRSLDLLAQLSDPSYGAGGGASGATSTGSYSQQQQRQQQLLLRAQTQKHGSRTELQLPTFSSTATVATTAAASTAATPCTSSPGTPLPRNSSCFSEGTAVLQYGFSVLRLTPCRVRLPAAAAALRHPSTTAAVSAPLSCRTTMRQSRRQRPQGARQDRGSCDFSAPLQFLPDMPTDMPTRDQAVDLAGVETEGAASVTAAEMEFPGLLVEHVSSERHASEPEIHERLQRDCSILSGVSAIITLFDLYGRVLHQNALSVDYMGYHRSPAAAPPTRRDTELTLTGHGSAADGSAAAAASGGGGGGGGAAGGRQNTLERLFELDPGQFPDMWAAVLEGRLWKGILRVPAHLLDEPDEPEERSWGPEQAQEQAGQGQGRHALTAAQIAGWSQVQGWGQAQGWRRRQGRQSGGTASGAVEAAEAAEGGGGGGELEGVGRLNAGRQLGRCVSSSPSLTRSRCRRLHAARLQRISGDGSMSGCDVASGGLREMTSDSTDSHLESAGSGLLGGKGASSGSASAAAAAASQPGSPAGRSRSPLAPSHSIGSLPGRNNEPSSRGFMAPRSRLGTATSGGIPQAIWHQVTEADSADGSGTSHATNPNYTPGSFPTSGALPGPELAPAISAVAPAAADADTDSEGSSATAAAAADMGIFIGNSGISCGGHLSDGNADADAGAPGGGAGAADTELAAGVSGSGNGSGGGRQDGRGTAGRNSRGTSCGDGGGRSVRTCEGMVQPEGTTDGEGDAPRVALVSTFGDGRGGGMHGGGGGGGGAAGRQGSKMRTPSAKGFDLQAITTSGWSLVGSPTARGGSAAQLRRASRTSASGAVNVGGGGGSGGAATASLLASSPLGMSTVSVASLYGSSAAGGGAGGGTGSGGGSVSGRSTPLPRVVFFAAASVQRCSARQQHLQQQQQNRRRAAKSTSGGEADESSAGEGRDGSAGGGAAVNGTAPAARFFTRHSADAAASTSVEADAVHAVANITNSNVRDGRNAANAKLEGRPVLRRLNVTINEGSGGEEDANADAAAGAESDGDDYDAVSDVDPEWEAAAAEEADDGARWHEVTARPFRDPVSRRPCILLMQMDVTAKVETERRLAELVDAEHKILEQLFPRHVLEHMAVTTARAAQRPACAFHMFRRDTAQLATKHEAVSILFADIKGFTSMCKEVEPEVVMSFLNDLYNRFDTLLDVYGVYKVETIGDCYMVAGGLIRKDEEGFPSVHGPGAVDPLHAVRVMSFAKAMLREAGQLRMPLSGEPLKIRVGVHSGPVMSGVVGMRMPRFCLFGDTVNTASRMESTAEPGTIHVSSDTQALLPRESWTSTGGVEVKGKGMMHTFTWQGNDSETAPHLLPRPAPGSIAAATRGGGSSLAAATRRSNTTPREKSPSVASAGNSYGSTGGGGEMSCLGRRTRRSSTLTREDGGTGLPVPPLTVTSRPDPPTHKPSNRLLRVNALRESERADSPFVMVQQDEGARERSPEVRSGAD